tara:strand:+ start:110 stop:1165 length:1056 start_codon:yes stop_codon:yes gene_type:complete
MAMRISRTRIDLDDNTLQKPVLKDYGETLTTGTGTTDLDLVLGNVFEITMDGNLTFTFSNPPASGTAGSFTLILIQDGTGSRLATWPDSVDWTGGTNPTLTTTASAVDILTFITTDGGTTWLGFLAGADFLTPTATSSFTASAVDTTDASSYTFSSQAIGAADSTRIVVVGIATGDANVGSPTINSVTVGGSSATAVIEQAALVRSKCAIYQRAIASGTTADIVVNLSGSAYGCGIGLWRMVGANSTVADTAADTAATNSSELLSTTIDVPANGVLIGVATAQSSSGDPTFTWSEITERYEIGEWAGGGGDRGTSGASLDYATTQTGITVTCDQTNGNIYEGAMVLASWGP